jgi:endonuclease/exonuclease/phosphatase (EEP) superfamily protein YafD
VAASLIVINIVPVAYLYLPQSVTAASTNEHANLRVLQFNLQGGKNRRYEDTLSLIKKIDPDLVGLSELTSTWGKVLEENLTDYPYRIVEPHRGGVSLFSKYPIANAQVKYFGKLRRPRIQAQLNFKGQDVDVVFIHPVTPNRSRGLRNGELALVAVEAKAFKNPGIVFGDMNTTPWSGTFDKLLENGGLLDSERGFGYQPTWNAKMRLSLLPIDHLLSTPQFAVRERRVLNFVGSDHLPLLVELELHKS